MSCGVICVNPFKTVFTLGSASARIPSPSLSPNLPSPKSGAVNRERQGAAFESEDGEQGHRTAHSSALIPQLCFARKPAHPSGVRGGRREALR